MLLCSLSHLIMVRALLTASCPMRVTVAVVTGDKCSCSCGCTSPTTTTTRYTPSTQPATSTTKTTTVPPATSSVPATTSSTPAKTSSAPAKTSSAPAKTSTTPAKTSSTPTPTTTAMYELVYTLDNSGEFYMDGALRDATTAWPYVSTLHIPTTTQVLAFKVYNTAPGPVGVRARMSNGMKTDATSSWRCSDVEKDGWARVGFDDSNWVGVDEQYAGDGAIVGGDAVTIGCGSQQVGYFFFRKTLKNP